MLSINQIYDKGCYIIFTANKCETRSERIGKLLVVGVRSGNLYHLINTTEKSCLLIQEETNWMWYKRLGYMSLIILLRSPQPMQ